MRICPSDSHPSGGFPVADCGLRISKNKKRRFSCGSGFPVLSLSKGSRDLDCDFNAFNNLNDLTNFLIL